MDLAVAQELGLFQAGDEAQHARLFAELHVVLETHQVEALGAQVLLAELHARIRAPAGARIGQPHRLHRAEAQRVAAAPRDLLDRQAGFEVAGVVLGDVGGDAGGGQQFVDEALVLLAVERAIEIVVRIVGGLAVARGPERYRGIDRLRVHDRADAVVEVQARGSGEPPDFFGQRAGSERSAGHDPDRRPPSSAVTSSRRSSMQRLVRDRPRHSRPRRRRGPP